MEETTATLNLVLNIKLTGENGAPGTEQPGISAEDKAVNVQGIIKDQIAAIKRTYDTGVDIMPGSKLSYVGRVDEVLN
jgi:hypothetical protein